MKKHYSDDCFGVTMECPICGKIFWVASLDQYVYKSGGKKSIRKYYCSYSCWRKDGN